MLCVFYFTVSMHGPKTKHTKHLPQADDTRSKENGSNLKPTQCHCEGSTPAAATDECCRSREHEGGDLEEKGAEGRGAEVGEVRNVELGVEEVIERRMGFLCIWGALARSSGINNAI